MNDISWRDIIGKRSDLKLGIAKVLAAHDLAPGTGSIFIDKLNCHINESTELIERYCYDGSSYYLDGFHEIKYREVAIFGFEHLGEQYNLENSMVCRRKGDKRNKDERPWGFYFRTAPFKLAPLSKTSKEIIFGIGTLGGGLAGSLLGYSIGENPEDAAIKGALAGFFSGWPILGLLSFPLRLAYQHLRFPMDYLSFRIASNTTDLKKLARLINSRNYEVRTAVAENQVIKDLIEQVGSLTDPEELNSFSHSPFPCLRGAAAQNNHTSSSTLKDLINNDKFWLVRLAAAKNLNAYWENVADFLSELKKATYEETTSWREWDIAATCGGLWTTIYETTEYSYYPERTLNLAQEIMAIHQDDREKILNRLIKLNPELHKNLTYPESFS